MTATPSHPRGIKRRLLARLTRRVLEAILTTLAEEDQNGPFFRRDGKIVPWNQHGGLTLLPLPGFEEVAERVRKQIEERSRRWGHWTPVDIARIDFGEFANHEPDIKLDKRHVGGHDVVIIGTGPGTERMVSQIMWALNYTSARRASRIMTVFGYFPMSRSDKDEGNLRLTHPPMLVDNMKAAGRLPSGAPALDRIVCPDPHSPQLTMAGGSGFVTPIRLSRRLLDHVIPQALKENTRICLAFPDEGASKRFEPAILRVSQDMQRKLPIVYGVKRRDMESGKSKLVAMYGDLDALPEALVIMLDDEIATGGSVIDMGKLLKARYRARTIWSAVTHGVFAGPAVERFMDPSSPVERILTMDTIPAHNRPELAPMLESGLLRVHTWEGDLAKIIYHYHWDEDIRELR